MVQHMRAGAATAVLEAAPREVAAGAAPAGEDPLYPVALLKVAMSLRTGPGPDAERLERLLVDVLDGLSLDRTAFGRYVERNRGRLLAVARSQRY